GRAQAPGDGDEERQAGSKSVITDPPITQLTNHQSQINHQSPINSHQFPITQSLITQSLISMGTLASELGPFAEGFTQAPRIYVDANLPAGLVRFMRERLHWDVLFVIEEDSLRRARDIEHFRLAMQLRRTLVTLDQDFLDDDR